MKIALVLALAAVLHFTHARAAEARVFEGVSLDELNQTQRLGDMRELYERDPETGGRRFRMLKPVVQIPLGEAWLSFNVERNASYLNKVRGENPAIYFGPIAGDAFEIFKLEERFTNALVKGYAPDVEYRLALMCRNGEAPLVTVDWRGRSDPNQKAHHRPHTGQMGVGFLNRFCFLTDPDQTRERTRALQSRFIVHAANYLRISLGRAYDAGRGWQAILLLKTVAGKCSANAQQKVPRRTFSR